MTVVRQWRMSLGPASVTVATELPVGEVVAELWAQEEPPLYRLTAAMDAEDMMGPRLVHTASSGPAAAVWDAERATLTISAGREDLSGASLLYLAYLLLESRLQRYGYLTLYAAAACRDGRAVLLLGSAGAGKTTTVLRLCRDHGTTLIGNDLVVAGGPEAVPVALAGSRHVRLRHASIARVMPDLLGLFPGVITDSWRAKRQFDPARLGINIATSPVEITVVVFVHVDVDYDSVVDEPGDTLVHRLNLYENALRYIRGTSTPWLSSGVFGPYMPSLDDVDAHIARTATLERLMARSRYVAGPPAEVAEHVAALLATGSHLPETSGAGRMR